jgi:hypothetical protein
LFIVDVAVRPESQARVAKVLFPLDEGTALMMLMVMELIWFAGSRMTSRENALHDGGRAHVGDLDTKAARRHGRRREEPELFEG